MKLYHWLVLALLLLAGCRGHQQGLMNPAMATEQAPENFKVRFETTRGPFVVEVHRDWAPLGADRFYNLVKLGYFEDIAFFRVIEGFIVQFGISGDPEINAQWKDASISDDPVRAQNRRGFLTYAMGGPNSRTTQLFINLADNLRLDRMGFAPFGEVVEGMGVVDSFYGGYGEGAPRGGGPDQNEIYSQGNGYLRESFPKLDYVVNADIVN